MDEKFINFIIDKYKSFRQSIEVNIKSKKIRLQNNDCYLITDSWDIEFNKIIKSYESNKKLKKSNIPFTLPNKNPEFINNISFFIEFIKKQQKFKLYSKDFIDIIKEKFSLNICQNSPVKYCTGNNKIIIEFKDKNENNAVLINYPLSNYYTLYFIEIKKDERQNNCLYNKILSIEAFKEKIIKEKFNNIIYSKEELINNKTKCFPPNKNKIHSISKNKGDKKRKNTDYSIRQKQNSKKIYSLIDSNIFNKRNKNKNRNLSKENSINSLKSYSTRKKIRYKSNRKNKNNTKGDINDGSQISLSINLCDTNSFNPSTPKVNSILRSFKTNDICNISFSKENQIEKKNNLLKIKSDNTINELNEPKKNEEEFEHELYNNELIEENHKIKITNEKEYFNEFIFSKKKTIESDQEIKDKKRILKIYKKII